MDITIYVKKGYIDSDTKKQILQSEINENIKGVTYIDIKNYKLGQNKHTDNMCTELIIETNYPFVLEVTNLVNKCFNKLVIENKFKN